jgi:glutamate dehydrogenase
MSEHKSAAQLVEAIATATAQDLTPAKQKAAQLFCQALLNRLPHEDLRERDNQHWVQLTRHLLQFMRERRSGASLVKVYNPNLADHGVESSLTCIDILTDDMPFLVDSVTMAIQSCKFAIQFVLHPVIRATRDPGGHLMSLEAAASGSGCAESLMHFQISRETEPELLAQLKHSIERALSDVRASVTDFKTMRQRMVDLAEQLPTQSSPHSALVAQEVSEFLKWVAADHFTYLGYRRYVAVKQGEKEVLQAVAGSGLGVLKGDEQSHVRSTAHLAARELKGQEPADLIILTKTNARSTVHHPGYLDYIGVMEFDANGVAVVEHRFLGLYTSNALSYHPWDMPLLRQRIAEVQKRSGFTPDGHSGKALLHVLQTLPREELFQSSIEELYDTALGVLHLQERARTRLFVRKDRFGRYFSCLAFVPRERFNTDVRERIEAMLKRALHGERFDSTVSISDALLARLYVVVRPKQGDSVTLEVNELEDKLKQLVRNWQDDLRETLIERHGEEKGIKLANRFGRALPAGYIEEASAAIAANDVELAAQLSDESDIRMSLYRPRRKDSDTLHFKVFKFGATIELSDVLPMLEHFGLRVLSEHPYELAVHGQNIWIQDFELKPPAGLSMDLESSRQDFQQAFESVWRGQKESDGFNRLVLSARLSGRDVIMLRAYCKYLLQTNVPYSQAYIERAINANPLLARILVELFNVRFNPTREINKADAARKSLLRSLESLLGEAARKQHEAVLESLSQVPSKDRSEAEAILMAAAMRLLEDVSSLDEDRIVRAYLAAITATLRTNFYQQADGRAKSYVSLKFASPSLPNLPKPVPYREIFVYSPRVEGVHLRFGKVARGGLRWSDRREDFRTEVLGLVKAQQVKNTVIVPVGAKGGFYVKRSPPMSEREAWMAEGVACYRMFISGLLDITDNVVGDHIVPPLQVVRHDEDDPYLVVAADKGTATFSDIANAIAIDYGFWLGDAFASGGSKGYDHKKMGITAKGGWESVKRHFRVMGKDCQTQDFSCVGVGDMSGDVFGNGMLLSEHIRLLAAFDHRHIFLDPNPDAAISFKERTRMFNLPRSSWDDYDKSLISAGGGVYSRQAKTIPISAEVRTALAISAEHLSPADLMQAILKAPVELLWNGGIGTYVKSEKESHEQVGDRSNNPLRINGKELRAKVVGEGGNLGLTQLGRIEAAMHGVLLNTDFIDNSAGVDTSDHEVNIKILLNQAMSANVLSESERDALLQEMTDEVGMLVMRDNYRQNLALDLMQSFATTRLGAKQHFIRVLEQKGSLDRDIEFLPSDEEFAERRARGLGLTRPELAVLLSYSKIDLYQQLLDSDVPEDPYLSKELQIYFPTPLRTRFAGVMESHRLRREIIATQITNSMINRMGSTFVLRMQEDSGASPALVAKAYTIAREVTKARDWWQEIDQVLFKIDAKSAIDAQVRIWSLLRNLTRWLLNLSQRKWDIAKLVARYSKGFDALVRELEHVLSKRDWQHIQEEQVKLREAGFSPALAAQLAKLAPLSAAFDIVEVAAEQHCELKRAASVYFALGDSLAISWLQDQIEQLPVEGRWHANARGVMRDRLFAQHRALTTRVLHGFAQDQEPVAAWMSSNRGEVDSALAMFDEMRSTRMDYAVMSVAIRKLGQLVA